MKNLTIKQQVLQFVEANGSVRYVDIIKFIVDTKFNIGTCNSRLTVQPTWVWNNKLSRRSYYSNAVSETKHFLKGSDRLMKVTNPYSPAYNKYITVRNNAITIKS